ncbi:unnamed protein product [Mycena citricolor]|uniref:Fatty acid hydroxylase domain-containing protein n=1 Tax=Mycena citricolor TaxID=2018698 RepID=A0AAD2JWS1_9AGAR|nr:unnamed protein product [Mycena citricolor]
MDFVLEVCDEYLLDSVYDTITHKFTIHSAPWPRTSIPRQLLSLSAITLVGIHLLYFTFSGLSYRFAFNQDMRRHPRFLKNQEWLEIQTSLRAFPGMILLTLPWFLAEVRGFLLFTDYWIYWIHRALHIPGIYKVLHKPHHKWIVPTPWAAFAFHPMDGYLQSVPYHLFIFLFPLNRFVYLGLFVLVQIWAIFVSAFGQHHAWSADDIDAERQIHDSDMITGHALESVINGPAHHTLHHLYFTVNYGQYFTWADRVGKSYRHPESHLDPLLEVGTKDE